MGIDNFCEVIMYLIFLGTIKASRELIIFWGKKRARFHEIIINAVDICLNRYQILGFE